MADRVLSNGDVSPEVWWQRYNEYTNLLKAQASLNAKKAAAKKASKDDGIEWKDFQDVDKMRALSMSEQIAKHNRMVRMMQFLKQPIAAHMQMIDETLSDETGLSDEQREEKWNNHGYVKGRGGETLADALEGHDPNSDTGRWITAGHDQGKNALGTRPGSKGPAPVPKAAEPKPAEEKIVPKKEPEVEAAKKGSKGKGVTYWHHAERRQVFEIGITDAPAPEGSVSIRKPEYEKLKAEYDQEFDASSPPKPGAKNAPADDGFDSPPTPSKP